MALCKQYEDLTPFERIEFIGKLVHCAQSSSTIFLQSQRMIIAAEAAGTLDGVKILPENGKEEIKDY